MKRPTNSPQRQSGMSFIQLIFIFSVCGVTLLLLLKIVPAYIDYFTVKKMLSSMAVSEEVRSGTVAEIRTAFDRRTVIDYQKSVTSADLDITKEGGETVVTAAWQQRIPLFTGYTLLIDFSTSTADK